MTHASDRAWHSVEGRSFASPALYVQRAGELARLGTHVKPLGSKALVVLDPVMFDHHAEAISTTLAAAGVTAVCEKFKGECCSEEVERVSASARSSGATVLVGVGGGKTADTTKLAAMATEARLVIVPTIASTDAPCSAIAVRYDSHGVYQQSHALARHPDVVVVDSAVVAKAPVRFLVAGIGDALSTWFEARSNLDSHAANLVAPGLPPTLAGVAIARACHDVLMRDALAAKLAVEKGALTPAVENIIEANTLLSGLGFENCGVSAAHGIHDGLTVLDATHAFLHGEKVAFGILCLLMLEGRPLAEVNDTALFLARLGLPTRLADINLAGVSRHDLTRVAAAALAPGSATWKVAVPLSIDLVCDAIIATDSFTSLLKV
jgi:glycerol dehydrogenase